MTAALAVSETVYEVPLEDINHSTLENYRQRKGSPEKFAELVASVRARGVLSPLVLRRRSIGLLELVFGHRRLKAADEAGLKTVPCVIREYDDETVLDSRMIENAAREDVHPLDQASEYAEAVKRGHSPQAIAEKLGQSVRYVLQRLALNELCSAGQLALEQGYISLDVAVLIARLPSEKIQNDALNAVSSEKGFNEGVMLLEQAREEIETSVMLDLADAKFKLDDATLVPKAGPCTTCKKRTGNQAELFADASKGDLCIDSTCHRSKLDAVFQLRVKSAKVEGIAVVPPKKAREVLDNAYGFGSGELVRLDGRAMVGMREKQVRDLLGKQLPPITITQDPKTGLTVELVPRSALKVAASKAEKAPADPKKADAKAKAEREAERLKGEVNRRAMTAIVEAADAAAVKGKPSRALLRLAIRGALDSVWTDVTKKVADRRGLPMTDEAQGTTKKGAKRQLERLTPAVRIERLLDTLDEGQLFALLLELAMGRSVPGKWSEGSDCYLDLCTELGVDTKGIEEAIKLELKAKAKAKEPQRRAVGIPQPVAGVKKKRKVKHPQPDPREQQEESEDDADGDA